MTRFPLIVAALAVVAVSSPCLAQSAGGGASLTVQRGLSMSTVRPMRLELSDEQVGITITASNMADAPAMIQIAGDPGRVYRIRLPEAGADNGVALVENLKIWSANDGDISESRVARLDTEGRDLLHVSGQFHMRAGQDAEPIAALPLSIDYE
jgi:hypothetical protein